MWPLIDICGEKLAIEEAEELLERRNLAEALACFDRAERLGADWDRCAAGRWATHMLRGNLMAAWMESDAIRYRGKPDPHRFWNGEDISGKKLMLRCLHGFGDAVQMLQYIPKLQAAAAELTVEVAPRLLEIAQCVKGIGHVICWGEDSVIKLPQWDVQIEVMELPYLFRTDITELPIVTSYLLIPEQTNTQVERVMGPGERPRVGIVWTAGRWNSSRSLPVDLVQQLVTVPGIEFWNLQGDHGHDAHDSLACECLRDVTECGDGVLTLAAVMRQLDLVITVDTLAAHLAGALGRPAWLLLQYAADWRWMTERNDTPWYPSLRLYRQVTWDNWSSVVQRVKEDLKRWSTCSGRRNRFT